MVSIACKYGRREETVEIPAENYLGSLRPQDIRPVNDPDQEIRWALASPIGSRGLAEIVRQGDRVAVIISDITRPCPSYLLLPPLIQALNECGVPDGDILIVCGLGIHRPHRPAEMEKLVGAVYGRIRCVDSYGDDFIEVGRSSHGTPFQVFRPVAEADKRICLGNIDYHYFAGYSGGAKAIVPGVCTKATIQANHKMMLDPGAKVGIIDGNPVRADMEEIVDYLSIDFILNVVLDEEKKIIAAVAGHFQAAHRAGCRILDAAYRFPIRELAEIVISGANGFPKDINMYQAQKALDNAQWAAKPGGVIILVGRVRRRAGGGNFPGLDRGFQHPGRNGRPDQGGFPAGRPQGGGYRRGDQKPSGIFGFQPAGSHCGKNVYAPVCLPGGGVSDRPAGKGDRGQGLGDARRREHPSGADIKKKISGR